MPSEPILLLDVGNTRLKWALDDGGAFLAGGAFRYGGQLEPAAFAALGRTDVVPARVVASCVAGQPVWDALVHWVGQTLGLTPERLSSVAAGWGVVNGYAHPGTLGSDRWAALVAARARSKGHLCVVDAGTAITVDLLDGGGRHHGGFILPGLRAQIDGIRGRTALAVADFPSPLREPGRSTAACLANGTLEAACAFVESIVRQFERQTGEAVQCLLTGGDSAALSPHLQIPHATEPALVLMGLSRMAREDPATS